MGKLKQIFWNWRVIILIIFLVLSVIAVNPQPWNDGVAIRSVQKESAAYVAGIQSPSPTIAPVQRERVLSIDGTAIGSEEDYYQVVDNLEPNQSLTLVTNKATYRLITQPITETITLNETTIQNITKEVFDEELNKTINVTEQVEVNKTLTKILGTEDIGLGVYPAPQSNLRQGLDLSGGTRVLLKPEEALTTDEQQILLDNMKERLNAFGLSDITVRTTKDLSGELFILVEIAGANEEEVKNLLAQQGKFEAKIGNKTVFRGGEDILSVCRSAECSGLRQGCSQTAEDEWTCRFDFSITLSQQAAQRQADITDQLSVDLSSGYTGNRYLNESIDLFLDGSLVDSLRIGESLKGNPVQEISISGSGFGRDQQEARTDAINEMRRLQTILITGSLPVKLDVVKTDAITPLLGQQFIQNLFFIGIIAVVAVSLVVTLRYRKAMVAIPLIVTMLSEVLILFGVAALIKYNLDLVAIAGIIVAIGTGVDSQIVIVDETLRKETQYYRWQDKVKNAFFIIMASYFTLVVAMVPLFSAGAGLLKGFALTTVIGVSIGVFITRPAFAKMAEVLLKE